jgi:hypothetical protein
MPLFEMVQNTVLEMVCRKKMIFKNKFSEGHGKTEHFAGIGW